jgi:hypothetical protein
MIHMRQVRECDVTGIFPEPARGISVHRAFIDMSPFVSELSTAPAAG